MRAGSDRARSTRSRMDGRKIRYRGCPGNRHWSFPSCSTTTVPSSSRLPVIAVPPFHPLFPFPLPFLSAPLPPSFTNALERTHTAQIIHTHIYEYRSFLSLVLVAIPRLLVLFSSSFLDSRSFLIFHSLILNIQIQRISRTPSIIPLCSSLFMRFYVPLPYQLHLHLHSFSNSFWKESRFFILFKKYIKIPSFRVIFLFLF